MLELKNITKVYPAGIGKVEALKGISLQFRESEFVSILGPSGCGKTTTLNIVGGLDQYTSGDLVINGVSTREYRDRDWDAYRNHSVGFVFQTYNLIPHQSVLQNVELALSLSGVPKAERRRRAKEALERVGLGDQLRKKPGEMSGGQMQRVAIARAIVNDPDIILADEPTGALDTETSLQVMDILKEIARDRLVIMVTHNPDLANKYSTRIIRMLDGEIQSDSLPLTEEEIAAAHANEAEKMQKTGRKKLPSMSFVTSFGLSLKNLITKKGRTALTSFAGSIGIIGIALIYAVSQGMTNYINTVQEETLSSYPLTLEATHMDIGTLLTSFMGQAESTDEHENDAVYQKAFLYQMMNALNNMEADKNDLAAFKDFVEAEREKEDSTLGQAITGVQYTYDTDLMIYTKNVDGEIIKSDTQALMQEILLETFGMDLSGMMGTGSGMMGMQNFTSFSPMSSSAMLWQEMLPGDNGDPINPVLKNQYEVVYGSWPSAYNQMALILDRDNELDDMTLYAMGLTSKEDMDELVEAAINKKELEIKNKHWSYEEICAMDFRTILAGDCFRLDESTGLYTDLRTTETGLKYLYDNGTILQVTGIIRPKEDTLSPMLNGSIAYTYKLTQYIMEKAQHSAAIQAQQDTPNTDIFTGLPFAESTDSISNADKEKAFREYVANLDENGKAKTYTAIMCTPSAEQVDAAIEQTLSSMTRTEMEDTMLKSMGSQVSMSEAEIRGYLSAMQDEEISELFGKMVAEQFKAQYASQVVGQLAALTPAQMAGALEMAIDGYTPEQFSLYHDEILEFSDATYESNLHLLGNVNPDIPSTINLYAATFNDKEVIEDIIADYNADKDEFQRITYTDYVGLLMSSVTTIIDAITYVLIAFVAVSLVVSSIMIGVITLISVQERTKEIGILRAIGASKRNVSSMFNAETVIIGFTSGLLGVIITYLLCIPINAILHSLTGIGNLSAYLPVVTALILIGVSVLLTLISGVIPSRSAAKKDPVVALRTE